MNEQHYSKANYYRSADPLYLDYLRDYLNKHIIGYYSGYSPFKSDNGHRGIYNILS